MRGVDTSRFASTLAILVGGGVPLLAALASAARVMSNTVLRAAVERAIERVREGASLARALGRNARVSAAAGAPGGERRGEREARSRCSSAPRAWKPRRSSGAWPSFSPLLEPAMILVMGAIVLLIVLAILLPIIEINQLVR